MVDRIELEHLIDRAGRKSDWQDAQVDVSRVARHARVQHAAEVLLQLGHDHIAQELLRVEREGARHRISSEAEYPAA